MSAFKLTLPLLGLFVLAGCGSAEPPATTDNAATDATDVAGNAAEDHSMPDVALSEPPMEAGSAGSPDAGSAAAGDGRPAGQANPAPLKKANDEAAAGVDPIIEGLEFPNVDIGKLFEETKSAWEKSPQDPEAVLNFVGICFQVAEFQAQRGNLQKSHAGYLKAGEVLNQAEQAGVELPENAKAAVYYKTAGAAAMTGKSEAAVEFLEKSVKNGFADLNQLETDPNLASLRELPAYLEKKDAWQAKIQGALKEQVREELASGETFPFEFQLTTVSGMPISLNDYKGKVCIVDIWGTWCPPCRAEIPSFVKLQSAYGSKGFQMIGLNQENGDTEEERAKLVTDYIAQSGINYPCALITDELLATVPNFEGFPTTLFIDRTGKVRMKAVGLHDYAYLEAVVSALLEEEAPAESAPAAEEPAAGASE